jgi:hypothetical protein
MFLATVVRISNKVPSGIEVGAWFYCTGTSMSKISQAAPQMQIILVYLGFSICHQK